MVGFVQKLAGSNSQVFHCVPSLTVCGRAAAVALVLFMTPGSSVRGQQPGVAQQPGAVAQQPVAAQPAADADAGDASEMEICRCRRCRAAAEDIGRARNRPRGQSR